MKKMGKRFISMGLAAAMVMSMAACGSGSSSATTAKAAAGTTKAAAATTAKAATTAAGTTKAAGSSAASTTKAGAAGTTAAAGSYEKCQITFDWWGGDTRHKATMAAIDAFQKKYPGITVKANYGAWTDYETARAMEFSSKTAADVNQINANWINDYDGDGKTFIDLTTVKDKLDLTQWDQKYLDMCKDSKGGQASVPVAMTGRILYWDQTTFDEAGIKTPASLADLKAAGKTFKEKLGDDYYPLAMGQYDRMIFVMMYLQSKYSKPFMKDGKLNMTQDQLKEGLQLILDLEAAHAIPSIKTIDGDAAASFDVNEKFISGKYAGLLEWDSSPAKYVSALGSSRKLVVGDEFKDFGGSTTGAFVKVSMSFAISSTCKHPKEAAMLINYLLNDPEGIAILGSERGIPQSKIGLETLKKSGKMNALVSEAHDKVMASATYQFDPKFDDSSLKDSKNGAYADVFGGLSYGDYKIDDAAKTLYDAIMKVAK